MICSHNGIFNFEIVLQGKSAHSSQPSWGVNTITDAMKIIHVIQSFAKEQETIIDNLLSQDHQDAFTTINVAEIQGGTAYNIIPERSVIKVSMRPIPKADLTNLTDELINRILNTSTVSKTSINISTQVPSLSTGQNTALEKDLCQHAKTKHSSAVAYATDGAHLQLMGMKPIIFGPGSIAQAHKPNEYIEASALVDFVPKLTQIVKRACC